MTPRDESAARTIVFPALVGIGRAPRADGAAGERRDAAVRGGGRGFGAAAAVLEARCGLRFPICEVHLSIAGGYPVQDPGADLSVAAALVWTLAERPLAADSVAFGKIALPGEVRPVSTGALRSREAAKLDFAKALAPAAHAEKGRLQLAGFKNLASFVVHLLGRRAALEFAPKWTGLQCRISNVPYLFST